MQRDEWTDEEWFGKGLKREHNRHSRRKLKEVIQALDDWDEGKEGNEPFFDSQEDGYEEERR